ncbi:MAG TPA: hypothetical protein VLY63_18050 [Anaerolineae bacterium]|nr:hypothetical protein [Anaerolineae bacterium]
MTRRSTARDAAIESFRQARRLATMEQLRARLSGRSAQILCYQDVHDAVKAKMGRILGLKEIPLDSIVGSVERCADYTRAFLPLTDSAEKRWADIWNASPDKLPPIRVTQLGPIYFVVDGHHRVSVARRRGWTNLAAHVVQAQSRVPISPNLQPHELHAIAEYTDFLERTRLDELCSEVDLSVSMLGQYPALEEQIAAHRALLEAVEKRQVGHQEAACRWIDEVYLPGVQAILEEGAVQPSPGWTVTDLYLWVHKHDVTHGSISARSWRLGGFHRRGIAHTLLAMHTGRSLAPGRPPW